MNLTLLKCKIHRATVTLSNLTYEGSIGIDKALMDKAGLLPNERVDILDINNGERFSTYVIESPAGSGAIEINGAAARLVQPGDLVIICAYVGLEAEMAKQWQPTIVHVDNKNKATN